MVAISGVFTKPRDVAVAMANGFDHVLAKRADPGELLRLIDALSAGDAPSAA